MSNLAQMDMTGSALTVLEIVLLGRLPELGYRVKDEDLEIALQSLNTLGIQDLSDRPFLQLSGGQQKLVLIVQTLVRKPKLILLDEPVNSLDMQKQFARYYNNISSVTRLTSSESRPPTSQPASMGGTSS